MIPEGCKPMIGADDRHEPGCYFKPFSVAKKELEAAGADVSEMAALDDAGFVHCVEGCAVREERLAYASKLAKEHGW